MRIIAPIFPIITGNGGDFLSVWKFMLAGALTGAVNGFFGGGGGCVLVPLLAGLCSVEQKKAFATSVAVIFPLCLRLVVTPSVSGIVTSFSQCTGVLPVATPIRF